MALIELKVCSVDAVSASMLVEVPLMLVAISSIEAEVSMTDAEYSWMLRAMASVAALISVDMEARSSVREAMSLISRSRSLKNAFMSSTALIVSFSLAACCTLLCTVLLKSEVSRACLADMSAASRETFSTMTSTLFIRASLQSMSCVSSSPLPSVALVEASLVILPRICS